MSGKKTVIPINNLEAVLSRISLLPVIGGTVSGPILQAGRLWTDKPTLFFVIRRPGCVYCREQAQGLINLIKKENLTDKINIVGIIKQVAPVPRAPTDFELGVDEFQKKYFDNHPLFLDTDRSFFKQLGNRQLLFQPWGTCNPLTIVTGYLQMRNRIKKKKITGNNIGEGSIQGGVIIIEPGKGVKFIYHEQTGSEIPTESICMALNSIVNGYKPSLEVVTEDTVESNV